MNSNRARFGVILSILAALICISVSADGFREIVLGQDSPPDLDFHFEGYEGYVICKMPFGIMNPMQRPWQVTLYVDELYHQGDPTNRIPDQSVSYRDIKGADNWTLNGGDIGTDEQIQMLLEIRIELLGTEAPGYYVANGVLEWMVDLGGGNLAEGVFTLQLHLNIPEVLEASLEPKLMTFPEHSGGYEGWVYSENQPTLTVTSNTDFQIAISSAPALTSENTPDYKMPMALRMWMPAGDATPPWETWGDLGGKPHGQISGPWDPALCNAASPWPGAVQQFTTAGVNEIGLEGAAWRSGLGDVVGKYNTTIVFTLSVP